MLTQLANHTSGLTDAIEQLENSIADALSKANHLEELVEKKQWPFPTYTELLFNI